MKLVFKIHKKTDSLVKWEPQKDLTRSKLSSQAPAQLPRSDRLKKGLWVNLSPHKEATAPGPAPSLKKDRSSEQLLLFSRSFMSDSLRPHGLYLTRLPCPWDSPGKNTGVGCHFLLRVNFPTQGPKPCLLNWQVDSLVLNHLGSSIWTVAWTKPTGFFLHSHTYRQRTLSWRQIQSLALVLNGFEALS